MTTYYATESGAGAQDGTSLDDAWAISGIVWATVAGNTLDGGGNTVSSQMSVSVDGVTIQNFVYSGGATTESIIFNVGADNNRIRNCTFKAQAAAMDRSITLRGANAIVEDCTFIQSSERNLCDVYVRSDSAIVRRCAFAVDNHQACVYVDTTSALTPIIEDCVFQGTPWGVNTTQCVEFNLTATGGGIVRTCFATGIHGALVLCKESDNILIYLNRVWNQKGDCIALEGAQGCKVYHNYAQVNTDDFHPALKLGDNFSAHDAADNNDIRNNIFAVHPDSSGERVLIGENPRIGASNTLDYNIYDPGPYATPYRWKTTNYASLAALTSATSDETNGQEVDPGVSGDRMTVFSAPGYQAGTTISGFHDTYPNPNGAWSVPPSIGIDDGGLSFFQRRRRAIR